jgi:predicted O-methyltransferase YrrM
MTSADPMKGLPKFREPMLPMGPDGGRLVETIVHAIKPQRGLEIGTSSGYSALCAMRGALSAGADFHLVTVDHDAAKAAWAQENFERAGVADRITIVIEDGLAAARKLDGPWDYILLDAAKKHNLPILKALLPKLNPGAVVLTDNVVTHEVEMREFTKFVRNHPELASGLFGVGNGIEVTVKLIENIQRRDD